MKKTLMAAAAMAFSAGVLAQSSVTLYGVADVAVGRDKPYSDKVQMHSSTRVNNSNSFIGLRGVEDLGGGLKAGFAFEQSVSMEDGSTGEAYNQTVWQRASNVWLGGNWGRVRLGGGTTPSFHAMEAWDLTGLANYSPAISSFGFVGGNSADRDRSLISYKTPVWGGFSAEIGYIFKADNNDNAKVDLALTYVNGPLSAGLAYNKTQNFKANYGLGAKYSFGTFTLAASYQDANNWGYSAQPGAVGRVRGVTLGGSATFGAFTVALDLLRQLKHDSTYQGVVYKQKKYTDGVLEMKYALSKRTSFYGVYLRDLGENSYALGVQHKF